MLRKLLWIFLVLAVLTAFLAWRIPAGWAASLVQARIPELSWSGVDGTIWNGQVEGLTWRGMQLGRATWRFDGVSDWGRRETAWQLHSESVQHAIDGRLTVTPRQLRRAENLSGHFPAAWADLGHRFPQLTLDGVIALDFEHVDLDGLLPGSIAGRVTWSDAGLSGSVHEPLGALELRISPEPGGPQGANRFAFNSLQPADLWMEGEGRFQSNDYEIEMRLTINPFRQDMLQFFEPLGETGPDGRMWLRWQGSFLQ